MKLLLDTHAFLWLITDDEKLPASWREAFADPANEAYLSVVSYWEIIIKHQAKKLPLPEAPEIYVPEQRLLHRIDSLELDERTVALLPKLPPIHRDPFDRMLVCQAQAHDLTLVTADELVTAYPVRTLA